MELYKIYNPITAMPFRKSAEYMEILPCEALRPYVRCFWGSVLPYQASGANGGRGSLVTPDTCMDVIFDMDHTKGSASAGFCGLDDASFVAGGGSSPGGLISKFGIRFYAWSAALFAEDSMRGTRNARIDAGEHFGGLKKYLEPRLYESVDIFSRAALAEKYLLKAMDGVRTNAAFEQAIGYILTRRGSLRMKELSCELLLSERQLERIFGEFVGVSPKKMAELVRYQYLWNELLYGQAPDIQDLVYRFSYTDQAHLLRDFKRFHTMTPSQAKKLAYQNVGFLQDRGADMY